MYISKQDLITIAELAAYVDGAVESADGVDENGNSIADYWNDFSVRVGKLHKKMKLQNYKQIERRVNKR